MTYALSAHPLHGMVMKIMKGRAKIDRWHLAVELGAPSQSPETAGLWGAYLAVADDALECLVKEKVLEHESYQPEGSYFVYRAYDTKRSYAKEKRYAN